MSIGRHKMLRGLLRFLPTRMARIKTQYQLIKGVKRERDAREAKGQRDDAQALDLLIINLHLLLKRDLVVPKRPLGSFCIMAKPL